MNDIYRSPYEACPCATETKENKTYHSPYEACPCATETKESETYHSQYEACPYATESPKTETYHSPYEACPCATESPKTETYHSPYEVCPCATESYVDVRCDYEILTDRIASLAGYLATKCPERRDEILRVAELIYHANMSLRSPVTITEEEIKWLAETVRSIKNESGGRASGFVIPTGSERGALSHVLRVDGKHMVRLLYMARNRGLGFANTLIDLANLVSDYFYVLALWLNQQDGVDEIPFNSRIL